MVYSTLHTHKWCVYKYVYVCNFPFYIYIHTHLYIYKSTKLFLCFFFVLFFIVFALCTNLSKRFLLLVFRVLYCECIISCMSVGTLTLDYPDRKSIVHNLKILFSMWSEVRCNALALPHLLRFVASIIEHHFDQCVVAVVRSLFKVLKCFCLNFLSVVSLDIHAHTQLTRVCYVRVRACMRRYIFEYIYFSMVLGFSYYFFLHCFLLIFFCVVV